MLGSDCGEQLADGAGVRRQCSRLQLLSVSEPHEADIEVMAADRALVYTAVRRTVRAWRRGTEVTPAATPSQHSAIVAPH